MDERFHPEPSDWDRRCPQTLGGQQKGRDAGQQAKGMAPANHSPGPSAAPAAAVANQVNCARLAKTGIWKEGPRTKVA